MSRKRKQKAGHKQKNTTAQRPAAPAKLPTAEQAVGAIVASIAPRLFDPPAPEEPSPARRHSRSSSPRSISPQETAPRAIEQRAWPRVSLAVAIGLGTESHFFAGLSGDISEGGVFVQTYRDVPVGADVELRFDLPEGELKANGHVRWHRAHSDSSEPGLGIVFDDLEEQDRRVIQRFCAHRAPLYYDVEHA